MSWFEDIQAYPINRSECDICFLITDEFIRNADLSTLQNHSIHYINQNYPTLNIRNVIFLNNSEEIYSFPLIEEKDEDERAIKTMFTLSYLYGGNSDIYTKYVSQTNGIVTTVSPSYFDIDKNGNLVITPSFDPAFIKRMKKRKIRVVPFLSNHWDRQIGIKGLENRRKLSKDISSFVLANNLDGVQVDIENVTEKERNAYTDLVRLLHQQLSPRKKEVSVAVAANPKGWTTGWHGSYDYPKLNQYSDYLMVMSYDESFYGGPPGPVASFPWVKQSIDYTLKQGVPAKKIVLGLPFFGRYWKQGEKIGGQGIPNTQINQLIRTFKGKPVYHEQLKSLEVNINIPQTGTMSTTTLSPGNYTIWYEDIRGVQSKLNLVREYRLKGSGSWKLGDEDTRIWKSKNLWRR